jgi:hypothetical protein
MLGKAKDFAKGLAFPLTAFFHLLFKTLALFVYMFGTWFTSSFVNIFIACILLLAFDFWTVKNVSGRLMVGLRWWSEVQPDGSTMWKYEAREQGLTSTSLDITIFWVGLFAPGVIWALLGLFSLMRLNFEWLLLILTALSLSGANIVGYVRCKRDASSKLAAGLQWASARSGTGGIVGRALQSYAGSALGSLGSLGGSSAPPPAKGGFT